MQTIAKHYVFHANAKNTIKSGIKSVLVFKKDLIANQCAMKHINKTKIKPIQIFMKNKCKKKIPGVFLYQYIN